MLAEYLSKTFYGNTIGQWAISLAIIVGALVVGKTLFWLFSTAARKLTAKTKSKVDDIIIDTIEEPIVFVVVVAGIWFGFTRLTLPDRVDGWIGGGVQALVIIAVTWLIARLAESLFANFLAPLAEASDSSLDDQLLPIVRRGTKFSIWALGIIVALNNAGYDVGALIAGLGIGGLALAMAARDTVSNVFGGFTIFTDRPFTLNDRVKVSGFDGTVAEIGIRSTRLRTLSGTLVTIPNSAFSDSAVENVSAEPNRKVSCTFGLTYDTTPEMIEQAIGMLRSITSAKDELEEKVLVSFTEFGDFSLNILLIYYIKKGADILQTQNDINLEILRQFNAAGLEFAFPTQTLYTIGQEPTKS